MRRHTTEQVTPARSTGACVANPVSGIPSLAFCVLFAAAVFCVYMATAIVLEARNATTHFGADSWYYAELAKGDVFSQIKQSYNLDRVARFHPTTVVFAAAWMQVLWPLTAWVPALYVLKAMFALFGAIGAWAALSAFATILPRRDAILFSVIYATSFGVWYFASFEESKIITATLSTLYIAVYLRIRNAPTPRGIFALTMVLLVACLNEMISGFLAIIPMVELVVRRQWSWHSVRWITAHVLTIPVALFVIEGLMFNRMVAATHPEGTSHVGMLFAYIARNKYNLEIVYSFVSNWLLFNVAAPAPDASFGVPPDANYRGIPYKGYFAPLLMNYFTHPTSAGVAILFCVLLLALLLPRYRPRFGTCARLPAMSAIVLALVAFTLLRGVFFFVFNPNEPLLFSPAVTLPHLLLAAIPFTYSKLPAKGLLLASFAVLLFIANGAFMIGIPAQ